jgi:ribosome-binding factor A
MRHRKRSRHGGAPFGVDAAFAEVMGGSGGDERPRNRQHAHKALALCRQVQRTLSLSLGDCGDKVLNEAYVVDVTPGGDSSRLIVHVMPPRGVGVAELLGRLDRAAPKLRAEVARAITRRRAPELSFVLATWGEVTP